MISPVFHPTEAKATASLANTAIYFSESVRELPDIEVAINSSSDYRDALDATNNLIEITGPELELSLSELRRTTSSYPRVHFTMLYTDIETFLNVVDAQVALLREVGRDRPLCVPVQDGAMMVMLSGDASDKAKDIKARMRAGSDYLKGLEWMQEKAAIEVAEVVDVKEKDTLLVKESTDIKPVEPQIEEVKKEEAVVEAEIHLPDCSTLSGLRTFHKSLKAKQIKDPMDALCLDLQFSHMSNGVPIPSETLLGWMCAARVGPGAGPQRAHTPTTPVPAMAGGKARTGAAAKYSQANLGVSARRSTHIAPKPTPPTKPVSLNELIESLSSTSVSGPKGKKNLRNRPTAESYFSPTAQPGPKTPVFGVQPRRISSGTYKPIEDDSESADSLPDYEEANTSTESVGTDDEPPTPGTPLMELAEDERDPERVVLKFDFGADFISFADAEEEPKLQMKHAKAKGKMARGAVRAVKVDRANPYSRPVVPKAREESGMVNFDFAADFISFADTDGDDEEEQVAPKLQVKKSKGAAKIVGGGNGDRVNRRRPVVPRVQAALEAARESGARVPNE